MIKIIKQSESSWCVWNTKTKKCADIVKIEEYNAFIKRNSRYRVDVSGSTIKSMIENFQTAKNVAYKAVREG